MGWKEQIIGHKVIISLKVYDDTVSDYIEHPRILKKTKTYIEVEFFSTGDYDENAESVITEIMEHIEKMDKACKVRKRILNSLPVEYNRKREHAGMEAGPTTRKSIARPKKRSRRSSDELTTKDLFIAMNRCWGDDK